MANGEIPEVGRFRLFKSLKKGGMARVYLAVDLDEPDVLYAVKTLLPDLGQRRVFREMFASEGKVGLRLDHPNIVRTVDFSDEDELAFIAMEFIFGFDLSTVLRRLRKAGDTMPLPLALHVGREMLRGLRYAHELLDEFGQPLNIVNRDVSPGNIMLGFDGTVKLIDFGIAQTTIDVRSQIGTIKGKISYMSPEQVRGLPVDQRSDVFSAVTVLYQMMTGLHVFHDEGDFATMERVRRAQADPPSMHASGIEPELDAIILKAMARDTADRYPSARAVIEDLEVYMTTHGVSVADNDVEAFMRDVCGSDIDRLDGQINDAKRAALSALSAPPGRGPSSGEISLESDSANTQTEPGFDPMDEPRPTLVRTPSWRRNLVFAAGIALTVAAAVALVMLRA